MLGRIVLAFLAVAVFAGVWFDHSSSSTTPATAQAAATIAPTKPLDEQKLRAMDEEYFAKCRKQVQTALRNGVLHKIKANEVQVGIGYYELDFDSRRALMNILTGYMSKGSVTHCPSFFVVNGYSGAPIATCALCQCN
jgi:hypothetical protein